MRTNVAINAKMAVFLVKYAILKPGITSHYRELIDAQTMSADQVRQINWERRRAIISYAYENVPFYREKYSTCSLRPEDIVDERHWESVPVLTRDELKAHADRIIPSCVSSRMLVPSATGGSTGVPIKVFHDRRYPQETLGWRMLGWWNIDPAADVAYCWRLFRKRKSTQFLNSLMWWPTRRIWLDAACITERTTRRFLQQFNSLRPRLLQGYAGTIHHLADYVAEHGLAVHSPVAVWVTSSPLSVPQRSLIENVFKAPVYDQYGCGEVFWIAAQCAKRNGLHVFSDARHVEFLDSSGHAVPKGQYGNVAVTDLFNKAFPIIRYQNGDMGRQLSVDCECGLPFPLIDSIKGRTTDLVRVPNGPILSGDYLTTLFDNYPDAVLSFQIRQKADYSLDLIVKSNPRCPNRADAMRRVQEELHAKTNYLLPVRLVEVDEILADRGKLRFVISDVCTD